ncbi:MAG: D-alanine--poly(phosphoribitol) ligase subunit DltC [Anaerolineales bacterium]|nr:D-alanine--poly(phosphoribitol) ligase subunit DltC [Anaerolineales bacterium]MCZ2122617.1 D-alanine--poly(phosphoribitol) ligase subunit DltC [Anaerolineales bacterium]
MSVSEIVLKHLERLSGTDQVRKDLNIDIFGEKLLDSLASIELVLDISKDLGVDLTAGEVDREEWATPQKIIDYLEARVKQG